MPRIISRWRRTLVVAVYILVLLLELYLWPVCLVSSCVVQMTKWMILKCFVIPDELQCIQV